MPSKKVIKWETNLNGKLGCTGMVHIDKAPAQPIPERDLDDTVIEIQTLDNSYPPVKYILRDLLRLPLHEVRSIMSVPSHGMDSFEFAKWFMNRNETGDTCYPVAIYYYSLFLE
jgi:hypothetical protein